MKTGKGMVTKDYNIPLFNNMEKTLQRIKELEIMEAKGNLDEQEEDELESLRMDLL